MQMTQWSKSPAITHLHGIDCFSWRFSWHLDSLLVNASSVKRCVCFPKKAMSEPAWQTYKPPRVLRRARVPCTNTLPPKKKFCGRALNPISLKHSEPDLNFM